MTALFEPPAILLAIDVAFAEGTAEVVLSGELDSFTTQELSEQLDEVLDEQPSTLIFDLSAVTFIDVGAARALADTSRLLPGGAKPVIRKPSIAVRKLLRVTSFEAAFQFGDSPVGSSVRQEEPGDSPR